MLTLSGILVVVLGFALRVNPLLVVALAAIVTGLAAGHRPLEVVALLGRSFRDRRSVPIVWLALPVIGLLESAGLKERAREVIAGIRVATTGRVLLVYLVVRQ